MNRLCALMIFSLYAGLLASCGGGGGGGEGGSGASAATGVRILHAAIDHAPFGVYSSNKIDGAVQRARFGESTLYSALSTGEQVVSLSPAAVSSEVAASFTIDVKKHERRSVLVFGGEAFSSGLQTRLLDDAHETPQAGSALLRTVHGAYGASEFRVIVDGNVFSAGIGFGEDNGYREISAGVHEISLYRATDGARIAGIAPILESGKAYTLLAAGHIGYFITTPLLED